MIVERQNDLRQHLQGAPWKQVTPRELAAARAVPSMLREDESKLYYWLGKNVATNDGAICDLGAFVGGSSARLAAGVMAARKSTKIHAYDRFTAGEKQKAKHFYPNGIAPFEGDDILWLSKELLTPFAPHIVFEQGDIAKARWTGPKIDVLCPDASKSRALANVQAEIFWPHLRAGSSVIVQQDFLHTTQPWIATQVELWRDHFTEVAFVRGTSLVLLCTKTPSKSELATRRLSSLSHAEQGTLLDRAAKRLARLGPPVGRRLREARVLLDANPGVDKAWLMKHPVALAS